MRFCADCEFYMYNLGYSAAFPELNGGKFPLTQNMQVELGVVAAAAVVSSLNLTVSHANAMHRLLLRSSSRSSPCFRRGGKS